MTAHDPASARLPADSSGTVEFSTLGYAEREGFSFWQDEICRYLSPSLTERINPHGSFAAKLRRVVIGRAEICDISFSPMRNTRDARCLRKMPDDDLFVAVMRRGTGQLQQCGRSAAIAPGDVVLYDSSRPFEWRFGEESRMLVARMRRRQLSARLREADCLVARVIPAAQPSASIVGNTVGEMMRLDEQINHGCAARLGDTLVDLIASSLEAGLSPLEPRPALDSVLERAKTHLQDNLEDPELGLEKLTRHLGVSVKTVCRAFAAEGTTPIRWLWQQRLDLSSRMLREGRTAHVGQVAMLCGFSDFSHFSRSFRKAYGISPKAALRRPGASETSSTC